MKFSITERESSGDLVNYYATQINKYTHKTTLSLLLLILFAVQKNEYIYKIFKPLNVKVFEYHKLGNFQISECLVYSI